MRPSMPKERRTARLTVNISTTLKSAIEEFADEDNRTVSDWIAIQLAGVVAAERARREAPSKSKR
jgi:hypothetical protein